MSIGVLVRHDPTSPALVRRQLTEVLAHESIGAESIDDVVLVASELVANAVQHAPDRGALDVDWDLDADSVVLRVSDASPEPPRVLHPSPDSVGGRGLAIVSAIASDWGVDELPDGKRVWARIPISKH